MMKIIITRMYWRYRNMRSMFIEWFAKHFPLKIPTKKPKQELCGCITDGIVCGRKMQLSAVYTGDGWEFFWSCDEHEDDFGDVYIYGWYPFWFDVWCKSDDLERIGIIVV